MRINRNNSSTIESSDGPAVASLPSTSRERQQTPLIISDNDIAQSTESLHQSKDKTSPPPNDTNTPFLDVTNDNNNEHYYSWIFAMAHTLYAFHNKYY